KKTLKIDVAKVQKMRAIEGKDADGAEWGVTLKDAEEETYTLLPKITHGGKPATLEGFVGRLGFGYKLFPPHTIAEIQFDEKGEGGGGPPTARPRRCALPAPSASVRHPRPGGRRAPPPACRLAALRGGKRPESPPRSGPRRASGRRPAAPAPAPTPAPA